MVMVVTMRNTIFFVQIIKNNIHICHSYIWKLSYMTIKNIKESEMEWEEGLKTIRITTTTITTLKSTSILMGQYDVWYLITVFESIGWYYV